MMHRYNGMRLLGFGWFLAVFTAIGVSSGIAWKTGTSWIPDPFFRIHISGIHRQAIHMHIERKG